MVRTDQCSAFVSLGLQCLKGYYLTVDSYFHLSYFFESLQIRIAIVVKKDNIDIVHLNTLFAWYLLYYNKIYRLNRVPSNNCSVSF